MSASIALSPHNTINSDPSAGLAHVESSTRHNSAEGGMKEVAIRNTFSHMINIAGIIPYAWNIVIDIQCTRYQMPSTNVFNELCVKTTSLRYILINSKGVCNAVYFRL